MNIVLASHHPGKMKEFDTLLHHLPITLIPQTTLGVPSTAETGLTFVENALIKARHACRLTGLPALADDSGLAVTALQGAPGIYSARYAGEQATPAEHINKLLTALKGIPTEQRGAHFYCALVLMREATDPTPLICEGEWAGVITQEPKGTQGLGYDPIFYVPSEQKTAAELPLTTKNRLSHRGIALQLLISKLSEQP